MFTGIVAVVGRVGATAMIDGGLEIRVETSWTDLQLGESIAVDGACLTVKDLGPGWFAANIVVTTLGRTNFATYAVGRPVNLERALAVGDRLGGHLVQGHVDGVGRVIGIRTEGDATLIDLAVPPEVADVSIPLGSVTVDGVSLTINALPAPGQIQLSLIPFTLLHTTLRERRVGDAVHVEGDTVGKYVRQFTVAHRAASEG